MQIKRAATAGSVFLIALGTGFVMQNADVLANKFSADEKMSVNTASLLPSPSMSATDEAVVEIKETRSFASPVPAEREVMALGVPASAIFADRLKLDTTAKTDVATVSCDVAANASPGPAATVVLSVHAPCHGNSAVTVSLAPLRFTETLDDSGSLVLTIPALSADVSLDIEMSDGTAVTASAQVPAAEEFERVALQWQGATGFQLHAFEFGATYGEPGHVHAASARSPQNAKLLGAGFLTHLGNAALPGSQVAEVYSFPSEDAQDRGVVRVTIEAEVTTANCGREVNAETLQPVLGGGLEAVELSLAMPGCEAVGDFLVLNNVLRDRKIAVN